MIKINITDKVKQAAELHWEWVARRFAIGKSALSLSASSRTNGEKRKKSLYLLLGYIKNKNVSKKTLDSNDSIFKELICASPLKLINLSRSSRYSSLILKIPPYLKKYYSDVNTLKKTKKNDPFYMVLKNDVDKQKKKYKKNILDYEQRKRNGKKIRDLLKYEGLYNTTESWNAYELCKKINLRVCPYCNRQYIFTVKNLKKEWTDRPQLDHFFVKSIYPFLSCSFYNLIPSCPFCNEGKGDEEEETIYPYIEEFGKDFVFRMDKKDIVDLKSSQKTKKKYNYSISLEDSAVSNKRCIYYKQVKTSQQFKTLLHASNKIFHLTELYNAHQFELCELLEKYTKTMGPELARLAKLYYNSSSEVNERKKKIFLKTILGIYSNDNDHILNKFKKDIFEQLEKEK